MYFGLQVAIKMVSKRSANSRYLLSPVESRAVPAEVALMQVVNRPPVCKNIIRLIEWFDEPDRCILVLERPDPCTFLFCPPEFHLENRYHADPATVWALGVLLLKMVCGLYPFTKKQDITEGFLRFRKGKSKGCYDLIEWCLQRNPSSRPSLQQIKQHQWFQRTVQA
ncbi:hypothetical protein AOLI_G00222410 [Acnodon oligacanthus]